MMIQPLYFLPVCLKFLWIQLPLSFTTRFIDKWFVSYHLTWHIPRIKHIVYHHFPWSVSTVVRHLQNGSSKTENHKGSSSIAIALRCLDFLICYNVFRLRSLLRFQDFAVLLASPDNCHGVSCVGTFGGNPANVDCVTIDYCTKYMYVETISVPARVVGLYFCLASLLLIYFDCVTYLHVTLSTFFTTKLLSPMKISVSCFTLIDTSPYNGHFPLSPR